jgi:hypothetical protein
VAAPRPSEARTTARGALVAEQRTEPTGPRHRPAGIDAVSDRSGARQHDDAGAIGAAGHERNHGVVDDAHLLETEAGQDLPHDGLVGGPIDTGDSDRDRLRAANLRELRHDPAEHLFHLGLTLDLQVGARAPGLRQHPALPVGQKPDRLGGSRIEADDVLAPAFRTPGHEITSSEPSVRGETRG